MRRTSSASCRGRCRPGSSPAPHDPTRERVAWGQIWWPRSWPRSRSVGHDRVREPAGTALVTDPQNTTEPQDTPDPKCLPYAGSVHDEAEIEACIEVLRSVPSGAFRIGPRVSPNSSAKSPPSSARPLGRRQLRFLRPVPGGGAHGPAGRLGGFDLSATFSTPCGGDRSSRSGAGVRRCGATHLQRGRCPGGGGDLAADPRRSSPTSWATAPTGTSCAPLPIATTCSSSKTPATPWGHDCAAKPTGTRSDISVTSFAASVHHHRGGQWRHGAPRRRRVA